MRKSIVSILMLSAVGLILQFSACSGGKTDSPTGSVVSGVAASGAPISGIVSLKDSSGGAHEINTWTAADGSFTLDVAGLTPPFMLKVEWTADSGVRRLYSFAEGPGTANINPLSNAAVAAAARVPDLASFYATSDPATFKTIAKELPATIDSLKAMLSPLFEQYKTAQNPISDAFKADHTGMDALFDDVMITVSGGNIVVTNDSGDVIFQSSITDIAMGRFYPENMPGNGMGTPAPAPAPTPIDGAALYSSNCNGCHGALASSNKQGTTAAMIQSAINNNIGGMGRLSTLTGEQIQAIAAALSNATPAPTPTPTPSPTPTPTQIDGAALYSSNCSGCHGALASSTKRGTTAAKIQSAINNNIGGMGRLSTLTSKQILAIATALSVTTPAPDPAPTDGATLYANFCSSCHGSLSRSEVRGASASKIQSEIRGVRAMNSLSSLTSTQIQAIADVL